MRFQVVVYPLCHIFCCWRVGIECIVKPFMVEVFFYHGFYDGVDIAEVCDHIFFRSFGDEIFAVEGDFYCIGMPVWISAFTVVVF